MARTIIVTGGAGFIGSNLAAELALRGTHDIVVCDWLDAEEKKHNLAKHRIAEILPPEGLLPWLEQHSGEVEAIFHMGAISSTTEMDVAKITAHNIHLPQALWKISAEQGIRMIYASSAATYGDGARGFKDDETLVEMEKLAPLNPYGWSKWQFDLWALKEKARPPQWAGLKFFNVYGPNEYHKGGQKSVVCGITPDAMAGKPVKLFKSYQADYADGGQLRDFVYVRDCVGVMLWLFDTPGVSGIYNVGTGKARSFADLARAVFAALGKTPNIQYVEMPEILREKYQYFTEADMIRLRRAGYTKPFTELEDGVREYVTCYLTAEDKYR